MGYRITCAAIALALMVAATPLAAGTVRSSSSQAVDSGSGPAEKVADPFVPEPDGEDATVSVKGRLVLPWGRNDDGHQVVLSLKNDSKKAPRAFKAVFFNPAGEVVAASEKLPLPPRGSVAFPVDDIIAEGEWLRGSIEIVYTGPGSGRVFGNATQFDLAPIAQSETQGLVQAGFHVSKKPADDDGGQ